MCYVAIIHYSPPEKVLLGVEALCTQATWALTYMRTLHASIPPILGRSRRDCPEPLSHVYRLPGGLLSFCTLDFRSPHFAPVLSAGVRHLTEVGRDQA